jgi:hypothetical protein
MAFYRHTNFLTHTHTHTAYGKYVKDVSECNSLNIVVIQKKCLHVSSKNGKLFVNMNSFNILLCTASALFKLLGRCYSVSYPLLETRLM